MALAPTIGPNQSKSFGSRPLLPVAPAHARRIPRWFRILILAFAACLILDFGLSLLLEAGWLNRALTLRLEAAFGRPVEVSNYSFSLLEGPRLEANYITVAEDPRFGNEYFLRADQLAVGARWSELLRGHMEFGALSFVRPHLNLVHLPDGQWNLESWLPAPRGGFSPARGHASARISRIDVSEGRVDFKQSDDKLPFAFVDVKGSVEQLSPGTWNIALEAQPFRSSVVVQQAGLLSLRGTVGGTSSRLRPAALELDWNAASLSDILRLVKGWDYGVRGLLSLQLAARTTGTDWNFSSRTQLRRLHRWDLALRPDDLAVNLNVDAHWTPGSSQLSVTQAVLEAPRSNIHGAGNLTWVLGANPARAAVKDTQLRISSDGVDLADVLTWYRGFHPGVADQITLQGAASLDLSLSGWPPRVRSGFIRTSGAEIDGGAAPAPIRIGDASFNFSKAGASLNPVNIYLGTGLGKFELAGSMMRGSHSQPAWTLNGQTADVRILTASAAALGFSLPPGWIIAGPAQAHLQWPGHGFPQGVIAVDGLKIQAPFLNREISRVAATADLSSSGWKVQVGAADAFGANWHGTFERPNRNQEWQFALAANELNASEMDRWLNPQRRQNFLTRLLPFLATQPQPQPMPVWLRARGTLALGQFNLAPFVLHQLHADAAVDGRELRLTNAETGFYGGKLLGSIALNLVSQPTYEVNAKFRGVNLSQLAAHTFSLAELFSGSASGSLRISAKGIGREALLRSLSCQGAAQMSNAGYAGMDLLESISAGARRPGTTLFPAASADFSCSGGKVQFSRLLLTGSKNQIEAAGYVDFQRQLKFELHPVDNVQDENKNLKAPDPAHVFELSGTLKSPQLSRAGLHPPSR
ncbi:MAG TPA: AsmA family protein [Candidatus Acidoferrales bacterium]|nr:AsmA family protein [Candidatus Acidoferrales bacterium]